MLKLFNLQLCPYCEMVRRKLDDLGLDYETIEVPTPQHERTEVFNLSGQYTVPVLVDEEVVLSDEDDIIDHLNAKYNLSEKGE